MKDGDPRICQCGGRLKPTLSAADGVWFWVCTGCAALYSGRRVESIRQAQKAAAESLTDADLDAIEARCKRAAEPPEVFIEGDPYDCETVKVALEAVRTDLPRLLAEVRRLRRG